PGMFSNSLPTNPGLLIQLAAKMQNGVTTIGPSVPVLLMTAARIHDDALAFSTADAAFNEGRSAQQVASDAFQATLDPLYSWLLDVSNMLASRFGTCWNTAWAQA